jgi:ACS family hexuronate transporter-like MFS transporter
VGSVVGIGGFAGAVSGVLVSSLIGLQLQATHSYVALFLAAGFAYLLALLVVQMLVPRMQPARLEPAA